MGKLESSKLQRSGQMIFRSGGKHHSTQSRSNIALALGTDDVKDWDDEELQYGRRRDKNGNLTGRPPSYIPKACHTELVRRTQAKAEQLFREAIPEVIPELIAIAKGSKEANSDQVRAINMVIERVLGKPIEHVQMTVSQPWKDALMDGIVGSMETVEAEMVGTGEDVVDAEIVEDDPDDDIEWEEAG